MKKYRFFIALMLLLASNALLNTHDINKANIIVERSLDSDLREPHLKVQYDSHDPIFIDGNTALIGNASLENWDNGGLLDGSKAAPFIIDNLQITNSTSILIEIKNTDLYFRINNCVLTGGGLGLGGFHGVYFYNVRNASIIDNQFINSTGSGINLEFCQETNITHNSITYSNHDGIRLHQSTRIAIKNNNISDSVYTGIRLHYASYNNTISGNKIFNSGEEGILSHSSSSADSNCDYNTFFDNSIYNNKDGIGIYGIVFNNLTSNFIYNNSRDGVRVKGNNNTFDSNQIYDNKNDGIWLSKSDWQSEFNNISNNNIHDNSKSGIRMSDSHDDNLTENQVSHNGAWGIFFERSYNTTMIGNTLVNDSVFISGDDLTQCLQSDITANLVDGNPLIFWQNKTGGTVSSDAGQVILINCTQVEVTGVNLLTSEVGLLTRFCFELNIHANSFSGTREYGVYLEFTNDSVIADNDIFDNKLYGLYSLHCHNNTISQNEVFNNEEGLHIASTSGHDLGNNQILNNEVYNNNKGINLYKYSYRNNISNNEIKNNEIGIDITYFSDNNTILNNHISYNVLQGVHITSSDWTIIKDNTLFNCTDGISLVSDVFHSFIANNTVYNCSSNGIKLDNTHDQANNTVIKNRVYNNRYGIHLSESYWNILQDNNAYNNQETGILFSNSHENIVFNNSVYHNGYSPGSSWAGGIIIKSIYHPSFNNTIANNTVYSNTGKGIWVSKLDGISTSINNTVANNTVYDNSGDGIFLENGNNCTMANNSVYLNAGHGIAITNQANTTIKDNILSNNKLGIYMESSANNSFIGNVLTNDYIDIRGSDLSHFILLKESDNWINGQTLVYWKDKDTGVVPTNGGQIILVDCSNLEATNVNTYIEAAFCTNLDIHHNSITGTELSGLTFHYTTNSVTHHNTINNSVMGIELLFSNDSTFESNVILNNIQAGIFLYSSNNNIINNSDISGNGAEGVDLSGSSANKILNNTISNNSGFGVMLQDYYFNQALYYSNNNTISGNIISYCVDGAVYIDANCDDNNVTRNDFIENLVHNHGGVNTLNISHNYWFPYWTTPDNDSDGYVDNPYYFPNSGDNRFDPYPLSSPNHDVHYLSVPVISHISDYAGKGLYSCQWAASVDSRGNTVSYSLYYSLDNGVTWKPLISNYDKTRYDFPAWIEFVGHNNSEAQGKVVASAGGLTKEAYYNFTIKYPAHTLSAPTIISPNGGEIITSFSSPKIEWTATVDSLGHEFSYTIYYSADGGSTWIEVKSGLQSGITGYYWDVSSLADGSNYLVKVVAISQYGLTKEDKSDTTFTIQKSGTTIPPTTIPPMTTTPSTTTQPPEIESSPGWTPLMLLISLISYITFRRLRRKQLKKLR